MSDVDLAYRKYLADTERARLDAVADSIPPTAEVQGPPSPPSPAEEKVAKPSAVAKGAKTTVEAAGQAFTHFTNGLATTYQSTMDPNASGLGALSGFGEQVLGGLTLMMALPAGAGAGIKQAMTNYTPGLEKTVAIPGALAGAIRTILGAPSFLLDPTTRKLVFSSRESLSKEEQAQYDAMIKDLDKPMTFGELFDTAAQFAVPWAIAKGLKGRTPPKDVTPTPEPLKVQEATRGAWQEPTSPTEYPSKPWISPEDMAARLGVVAEDLHPSGAGKSPLAGAQAPKEAPTAKVEPTAKEGAAPSTNESYTTQLQSALEIGIKKAEELIGEEVKAVPELKHLVQKAKPGEPSPTEAPVAGGAKVDKRKGKPVSNEPLSEAETARLISYGMTPEDLTTMEPSAARKILIGRKMDARELAIDVESEVQRQIQLSEGPGEMVTLYRGEGPIRLDTTGRKNVGEWFTTNKAKAESYAKAEESQIKEIQISRDQLDKYTAYEYPGAQSRPVRMSDEYIIPKEDQIKLGFSKVTLSNESPVNLGNPLTEQSGKADVGLLARLAVGAAIGGTQGDTPEERIAYMLGLGLAGAKAPWLMKYAKNLVGSLRSDPKTAPLLDVTNPKVPGTSPPVDPLKGIQKTIDTVAGPNKDTLYEILKLEQDTPVQRETLRLGKQLEMKSWEHVKSLVDSIVKGDATEPGALRNALALSRVLHDQLHQPGRRFGASGNQGAAHVKANVKAIDRLATEWDASTSERDIAIALSDAKTLQEVGLRTRLYYAIPESILQLEYGAMLSGAALVKNGVGSIPMLPIGVMQRSLAQLRLGKPAAAMNDGVQGMIVMGESIMDQLRLVAKKDVSKSWAQLGEQAREMGATHVEFAPRGLETVSNMLQESGSPMLAAGFKAMDSVANFGPGIMSRTDGQFKAINGRIQTHWETMDAARAEGLSEGQLWNRRQDLVNDYSQLSPDALARIIDYRNHQTFTSPFEGRILNALQAGPTDPLLNLGYRTFLLPFVRTPIRLMEIGAEYTPGLNFAARHFYTEWGQGGIPRATAEARLAIGGTILAGATWLSMQGLLTGNLPNDARQAQTMGLAGRPAQSFWDPLAGKYRSYAGMEPLTQWVSMGSDIAYVMGRSDESTASRFATAYAVAISRNTNLPRFLQSVSALFEVITAGSTDAQFESAVDYVRKSLGKFVPAAVREVAGTSGSQEKMRVLRSPAFDEDKSEEAIVYRELQALLDDWKKSVGMAGDNIKVTRNMFTGTPLLNDHWPWNPFTTTPAQPEPWATEIQRLQGAGLTPLDEWLGKRVPADIGIGDKPTVPGVRMSAKELDRLEVIMTQEIEANGDKLTASLNDLVTSDFYKDQSEVTKKDLIHERWIEFKSRAEGQLVEEFPRLEEALLRKRWTGAIEYLPPTQQGAARETMDNALIKYGTRVAP